MNLHHLRYFLMVARSGGFTQAARLLNVTQPTVSNGIAELERRLGVKLFHRSSRRVVLSMEGRTLMTYALQVEDLLEEVEGHLSRRAVRPGEGFQFGAIDAAVIYLLPEILKAYMGEFPELELSIQVAPSRYLVEDLLLSRSEFALISQPFHHPRIETVAVFQDDMPLVAGTEHPFARRTTVALEEVAQEALILFHADSISRKIVDERFAEAGLTPRVVMEMRSPEAMCKLVEAGLGISFLPRATVAESLDRGALLVVEVKGVVNFAREIGVAWRRGRYFGPAVGYLLEAIFSRYGKLDEWQAKVSAGPPVPAGSGPDWRASPEPHPDSR